MNAEESIKTIIEKQTYQEERALYGSEKIELINCKFEGEEDGESALKECSDITVRDSIFSLRYPLWHVKGCTLDNVTMNISARAPLWYTSYPIIKNSTINAPKAIRECGKTIVQDSIITSDEAFWKCYETVVYDSEISGEYLFYDSTVIRMKNVTLRGKYSLQYIKGARLMYCKLYTKDCFWHAKDTVILNSVLEGEYLGWYSENLTLMGCHIKGTQPLCYCKNLKVINCTFEDADLAFENSEVEASINGTITSIKNPLSGKIVVDDALVIIDEQNIKNGNAIIKLRNKEEN